MLDMVASYFGSDILVTSSARLFPVHPGLFNGFFFNEVETDLKQY